LLATQIFLLNMEEKERHLSQILNDIDQKNRFYSFLISMYCQENLDFYDDCLSFESLIIEDYQKRAEEIFQHYLSPITAMNQVSMDQEIVFRVKNRIDEGRIDHQLFQECKLFTFKLMAFEILRLYLNESNMNRRFAVPR